MSDTMHGDGTRGGRDEAATAGAERRQHPRMPRTIEVVLATADGAEYEATSHDVSEGGMYVTSDFLVPSCTVVQVRSGGAGSPAVSATVVRAQDLGDGVGLGLWYDEPASGPLTPRGA